MTLGCICALKYQITISVLVLLFNIVRKFVKNFTFFLFNLLDQDLFYVTGDVEF